MIDDNVTRDRLYLAIGISNRMPSAKLLLLLLPLVMRRARLGRIGYDPGHPYLARLRCRHERRQQV